MGGSRARGRGLACGLGVILGCGSSGVFLCEGDGDCQQGGAQGVCQATGYCSFPDEACPSGQRYGSHVGGSLAETCVDLDALTSDTGAMSSVGTSQGSTDGPVTTSTTAPPTTGLDDAATTQPVGDSGTSDATSTGLVTDGGVGSTSAGEVVCWVDDFDDDMIDAAWCPWTDMGIGVDELDGHMRFEFSPARWGMGGGGGQATTCDTYPLLGSEAAVEVAAAPQVSTTTEAYIEVGSADLRLGLGVLDGELYAFVWNGMSYSGTNWQPYLPDAQRWLRISGTDEGLVAEYSHDGVAWVYVYTAYADLSATEGTAAIGVWSDSVPLGPDEAAYESFELCVTG